MNVSEPLKQSPAIQDMTTDHPPDTSPDLTSKSTTSELTGLDAEASVFRTSNEGETEANQEGLPEGEPRQASAEVPTHNAPIELIDTGAVEVVNPRERNRTVFAELVENLSRVGLKKPISVTHSPANPNDTKPYKLICGQGRLEAAQQLGWGTIPAQVLEVSESDALVMSLVENIARVRPKPEESFSAIKRLSEAGFDKKAIVEKTGLSTSYVGKYLSLLRSGEERLLVAVEKRTIDIDIANKIASQRDEDVQQALWDAHESGELRGQRLLAAKRLVEARERLGRDLTKKTNKRKSSSKMTSRSLVEIYQREVEKQKVLVKKSRMIEHQLNVFLGALTVLLRDENFITLLRAEGFSTMPKFLSERLKMPEMSPNNQETAEATP